MYERIKQHQKHTFEYQKKCISLFKAEIQKGHFPQKCLACYIAGLNYCKYWKTGFNCEEYEVGEVEEISKKFK
jgi:hypothetical protein